MNRRKAVIKQPLSTIVCWWTAPRLRKKRVRIVKAKARANNRLWREVI